MRHIRSPFLIVSILLALCGSVLAQFMDPEAKTAFDQGLRLIGEKKYAEAVTAFDRSVKIVQDREGAFVNSWQPYRFRAHAYRMLGEYDRALKDIAAARMSIRMRDTDRAELFFEEGQTYLAAQRFSSAIDAFNKHVEYSRGKPERGVYLARGTAKLFSDQYEGAVADLTKAIDLDPEMVDAYVLRAGGYCSLNKPELAKADARFATQNGHPVPENCGMPPGKPGPSPGLSPAAAPSGGGNMSKADEDELVALAEDLLRELKRKAEKDIIYYSAQIKASPDTSFLYMMRAAAYCTLEKDALAAADEAAYRRLGGSLDRTCADKRRYEALVKEARSAKPPSGGWPTVSKGVLNSLAIHISDPVIRAAAKAVRASGTVSVEVSLNVAGEVTAAKAVSGHPLLRESCEQAARLSLFEPQFHNGKRAEVTGTLVFVIK